MREDVQGVNERDLSEALLQSAGLGFSWFMLSRGRTSQRQLGGKKTTAEPGSFPSASAGGLNISTDLL